MTSADAEKRIGHRFMIKTLRELGIRANFLSPMEGICEKPAANIIVTVQP